MEEEY